MTIPVGPRWSLAYSPHRLPTALGSRGDMTALWLHDHCGGADTTEAQGAARDCNCVARPRPLPRQAGGCGGRGTCGTHEGSGAGGGDVWRPPAVTWAGLARALGCVTEMLTKHRGLVFLFCRLTCKFMRVHRVSGRGTPVHGRERCHKYPDGPGGTKAASRLQRRPRGQRRRRG